MSDAELALSLPSFEMPPAEPFRLWRKQRGWWAKDLTSSDWTLHFPKDLARDVLDRASTTSSILEAASGWRPPSSATRLQEKIETILEGGIGLCLLRNMPLSGDVETDERAALLIGLLFGRPVAQTRRGNLTAKVEDLGHDLTSPNVRGHQTSKVLAFHSDRADRILLLCVREAKSGGHSQVVSSIALADLMRRDMPELAECLFRPFPQDRRGEQAIGEPASCLLPVFWSCEGAFGSRYLRRFIEDSQRHSDAPRLTTKMIDALDMLDALVERKGMALEMSLRPGDVQILNNNVVLHARSAFQDHSEYERRRLLLRVWLAHASARPLPKSFVDLYGATEAGAYRGGVWPDGRLPIV